MEEITTSTSSQDVASAGSTAQGALPAEDNGISNSSQEAASAGSGALSDEALFDRVSEIIAEVRPFIQSDGGDIELLKVEDNVVYVALTGACVGCPSSMVTLKHGVEARIREDIPQVESVEMV